MLFYHQISIKQEGLKSKGFIHKKEFALPRDARGLSGVCDCGIS